jgi:hypothetical protein
MPAQVIKINGARQHNLKKLHVEIPQDDAWHATAREEQAFYATTYIAGGEPSLWFTGMSVGPRGNFWANLPRNLTPFFSCFELIQLHV